MKVWINGSFVQGADATIGVFDAGFQHGVGLFETMLAKNGRVFRAREHMERLAISSSMLRLTENLQIDPLVDALECTLNENEQESARMRLTITGGDLNMLQQTGDNGGDPTIIIQTQPVTKYPACFYENGITVSLASGRINPFEFGAGHKTLNYWSKLLNLQLAAMQGCGEALWLTPSANIAGGCVSNLFVVRGGSLFTPAARGEEDEGDEPSAALPGVTRQAVIELADNLGIGTSRSVISIDDVLGGDEVFLTNSSWGVLPVVRMLLGGGENNNQEIMGGGVGTITNQLHLSYQGLVERETTAS